MRIFIKAKPGAKRAYVKEDEEGLFEKKAGRHLTVAVTAVASDGKANRAIEDAVAEYLGVARARVKIVAGHTSREKVIEVF